MRSKSADGSLSAGERIVAAADVDHNHAGGSIKNIGIGLFVFQKIPETGYEL